MANTVKALSPKWLVMLLAQLSTQHVLLTTTRHHVAYLCHPLFQTCPGDHQCLANPAHLLNQRFQANHSNPALPSGLEILVVRLVHSYHHRPLDQDVLKINSILTPSPTINMYTAAQLNNNTTVTNCGQKDRWREREQDLTFHWMRWIAG